VPIDPAPSTITAAGTSEWFGADVCPGRELTGIKQRLGDLEATLGRPAERQSSPPDHPHLHRGSPGQPPPHRHRPRPQTLSGHKYLLLAADPPSRDQITSRAAATGVQLARGVYTHPLHRQRALAHITAASATRGGFPLADDFADRHLCLPPVASDPRPRHHPHPRPAHHTEPGKINTMKWTVGQSRTLYDCPWFRLDLTDITLPSGQHIAHHVIRVPTPAVGILAVDTDGPADPATATTAPHPVPTCRAVQRPQDEIGAGPHPLGCC